MPTYPTLTTGAYAQLPLKAGKRYLVDVGQNESGPAYTYYRRANGQGIWTLPYPVITATEWETLSAFFQARGGRVETFDFTCPREGTTKTVRFAMDRITAKWIGPDIVSTSVDLEEDI
jgi:hypothetical protein